MTVELTLVSSLPAPKVRRPRMTDEEKAARAAERKAVKDAERAALRLAKMVEAAGPVWDLDQGPLVVDRQGRVVQADVAAVVELIAAGIRADGRLTIDVETSGHPVGHRLFELRTVQLGNHNYAAIFDPVEHAAAIWALLRGRHTLHAFSAQADIVPIALAGLADLDDTWARMVDLSLIVQLAGMVDVEREQSGLKAICAKLLADEAVAPAAEQARKALFEAAGWLKDVEVDTPIERNGWAQVDSGCYAMAVYAASDVLDTAALALRVPEVPHGPGSSSAAILWRERTIQAMTARPTAVGLLLDAEHVARMRTDHEGRCAEQLVKLQALGVENPGSPAQVAAVATEFGAELPMTKGGKPSAARTALVPLQAASGQLGELAKAQLEWRRNDTALKMFLRPYTEQIVNGDGRIRPTMYTLGTDTGRFSSSRPNIQQLCFSSDTEILTDQGWLAFPAVTSNHHVAQWKADGSISFVYPSQVTHEKYSGSMVSIETETTKQVVTPNHRIYSFSCRGELIVDRAQDWLYHGAVSKIVDRKLIRGGALCGRKLSTEERRSLYLAVAIQADGSVRKDWSKIEIQFSKKRKADRIEELGIKLGARPFSGVRSGTIYHGGIDPAELEPWIVLPEKTFNIPALLELDGSELNDLLTEIMFWDGDYTRGCTYGQHPDRASAVDAAQLVALLSGHSTSRYVKTVGGVDHRIVNVHKDAIRYASRTDVGLVDYDGWVHCVTVPSGAVMTRNSGKVVVSGNSREGGIRACVRADPGHLLIGADFSGVELRVMAALSGDENLRRILEEEYQTLLVDPKAKVGVHWEVARMVFGPGATKGNRYDVKRLVFGRYYGAGIEGLMRQSGQTEPVVRGVVEALDTLAPGVKHFSDELQRFVKRGGRTFPAYSGRIIHFSPGYPHKSMNYAVQGTARELAVDAMLDWRDTEWGHCLMYAVHDELDAFVPEQDADRATTTLVRCMTRELNGVQIVAEPSEPSPFWADSV